MTPRSTARRWARVAVPAAVTGVLLTVVVAPASAAPDDAQPTTAADAARAVADTAHQIEALGEQVNDAELALTDLQTAAADADATADQADAQVAALQPQVDAIVLTGFVDGVPSGLETVLTSGSADEMLQRWSTINQLTDHTDAVLAELAAAQQAAAAARSAADQAEATAAASLDALQTQQDELQTQLAAYRSTYAQLAAPQRAAVSTAVGGPELSAAAMADAAYAAPAAAPSEAAAAAIQTALAQVGKPYVVGAAGPDGFDCSGLTQFAYAAAGISLPHSSRAQSGLGTAVARADLQPGDLVVFYSPVSHVGMYIGNGQMVHASVSGRPVAVTSVDQRGYAGARRVA
ncbi:Cell wall-associated hydrolase, NlpC family [Klenkia marina]|uniref:Cell wall-associated hydrolase, NlpC family n=1 Tax=Klenkia marina TaxID=1960309 RepID=A0A1G4XRM4_9ACTN|nr:C40 family peptidase [Klenkia marina]SCX43903.1 Cell wall-associated hydrolase, NlpC family [Klenkia marina]